MRKLIVVLMFGTLLLPGYGFTLGLGEIEVNSALNQQLDARIELLSATPEDAEAIIVELASREEFSRAGLERPYSLSDLKFSSYVENDQVFIKVVSRKPVREPFLNFLIEIDWPKGHLLREYTILLDPPVFMGGGPAASPGSSRPAMFDSGGSAPTPASERFSVPGQSSVRPGSSIRGGAVQTASVVPAPIPPEYIPEPEPAPAYGATPEPQPAYAAEPIPEAVWLAQQSADPVVTANTSQEAPRQTGGWIPDKEHRIKAGDTAWSLAQRMRPDESISIQQMMLAMLRSNPEIFINGNINGLKRGFVLRAPTRDEINAAGISVAEARSISQEHNALWREYKQALAGDVPASALDLGDGADAVEADQGASDAATSLAKGADEAVMPDSGEARLSILSAGDSSASTSGDVEGESEKTIEELRAQLAVTQESIESGLVEKEALQEQVASLKQQLSKMENLLTIQDSELAKIQSMGTPGMGAAEQPVDQPSDQIDDPQEVAIPEDAPPEDAVAEEVMSEEDAMAALNELSDVAIDEEAAVEVPAETEMAEEVLTDIEAPVEQPVDPSAEVELMDISPTEDMQQEQGLVDALLNNKLIIGAVILLLLIVVAGSYVMFKQFRGRGASKEEALLRADSEPKDDLESDPFDDDLPSDEEVARAAAEDEFDSDATMILPSASDDDHQDTVVTPAPTPAAAAPAAESLPVDDEVRDDVIAEADVYLAYGIYQQAEELLESAVKEHPDKDAYRVKLAETYFASKNVEAMEKLGIETQKHIGVNDSPAWQKIVSVGKELCPDAEVFKNAGSTAALDMDEIAPKSPEPMDLDLGDDSAGEEAGELDFDFDAPVDAPAEAEPGMEETAVLTMDDEGESDLGEVEFDIGETDAISDTTSESSDDDFSLDIDAAELDIQDDSGGDGSLDFDMDLSDEGASESASEDLSADLDLSMDSDESSIEIDPAELESGIESEDSAELDALSESLELDAEPEPEPEPAAEPAAEPVPSVADAGGDVDLGEIDVDEVNTKLDLARAYLDMGDHEGTRDILDEVIAGGTQEQKGQAQELLKELG